MKTILIYLTKFYKKTLSPLLPPSCRYYPTCSSYMITALTKHGALKGSLMGIARIFRCHPFVKGGFDFVPDTFSLKRNPVVPEHFHEEDFFAHEDEKSGVE